MIFMTGLLDLKWEETDTDTSTSDLTPEMSLKIYNNPFQGAISSKLVPMTILTRGKTDTLYHLKIQLTSEDVDSENFVITNRGYSICLTNSQTGEFCAGMIEREVSVKVTSVDGSLREIEHITFRLQLTTSSRLYNTYALDIKGNHISWSTSLDLQSGQNLFIVDSNLLKTGWCTTLDIQLKSVTFGE